MTTRGAAPTFPAPARPVRPSDPFGGAIYDAKNASNPASRTMAAAALNQLVKDAALQGRGDAVAESVFHHLNGADRAVIAAFAELVIGDNSYQLSRWNAADLEGFARAASGAAQWPAGGALT